MTDGYGSGNESYSDKAKRAAMKNAAIAAMENPYVPTENPYVPTETPFIPTQTPFVPTQTVSPYTPPILSEPSYKIPILVLLVALIIGIILFFVLKKRNSRSVKNFISLFGKIW